MPVPCATRNAGRLAKLACGSNNASRLPPAFLRCSAPSTGTRKASRLSHRAKENGFHGQPGKRPKNETPSLPTDVFPGPLRGAEQRRKAGGLRRGLSEGRSPEFRSRPAFRVAQGTGVAGTEPGSPSFCLLFLGEARKSETPCKGGTPSQTKHLGQKNLHASEDAIRRCSPTTADFYAWPAASARRIAAARMAGSSAPTTISRPPTMKVGTIEIPIAR